MSDFTAAAPERTLGTIIKDLTSDLSMLIRSEIALVKLEVKESLAKLGGGAAFFAAALFLALIGGAFLFVTVTLGLIALGLAPWAASLLVMLVLFLAAGVFAWLGMKKMREVRIVPNESIDHIRGDLDALKADVARVRSR